MVIRFGLLLKAATRRSSTCARQSRFASLMALRTVVSLHPASAAIWPMVRLRHPCFRCSAATTPKTAWVLSGLAPPPLADGGLVGYRAVPHEGGRGCGAWNADRKP